MVQREKVRPSRLRSSIGDYRFFAVHDPLGRLAGVRAADLVASPICFILSASLRARSACLTGSTFFFFMPHSLRRLAAGARDCKCQPQHYVIPQPPSLADLCARAQGRHRCATSQPPVIAITEAGSPETHNGAKGCSMPVLVIAVVFFAIFLVMGVMGVTAMAAEHRGGKLFSWKWSDEPKPAKTAGKPVA